MRFGIITALALLGLVTAIVPPAMAKRGPSRRRTLVASYNPMDLKQYPRTVSKSVAVFDANTGQLLWQVNGNKKCYPASTTKILTGLLFAEATPADEIVYCKNKQISSVGESSLNIKYNESFVAEDLLRGFLLKSANDAGVVIAEHIDGSTSKFASRMNERAKQAGATSSHFVNPHGLHHPEHYTTAIDLGRIAMDALKNPRFAAMVEKPTAVIQSSSRPAIRVTSRAKSLYYDRFMGADGIKTGYTRPAGNCFVGSATRDGRRLISVVMGAPESACKETIPILSWAFRRFERQICVASGSSVDVTMPDGRKVKAHTSEVIKRSVDKYAATKPIERRIVLAKGITEIKKGDVLGSLHVIENGLDVGHSPLVSDSESRVTGNVFGPMGWFGGGICLVLVAWQRGRRIARRTSPKSFGSGRR
jgi:D-alanyl-D-alanine carboxypeptidase (penicillin-binding protein 5/6)